MYHGTAIEQVAYSGLTCRMATPHLLFHRVGARANLVLFIHAIPPPIPPPEWEGPAFDLRAAHACTHRPKAQVFVSYG